MKFSKFYCEILIVFLKASLCLGNWTFTKVFKDKALDGHSLFISDNLTEWQCLFESSNDQRSGSVNYHKGNKICVVNSIVDDEELRLQLKVRQGWTYYEKEEKVKTFFFKQGKIRLKGFLHILKSQGKIYLPMRIF